MIEIPAPTGRDRWGLHIIDIAELVREDGRLWGYWSSVRFVALALAESGGDSFATPKVWSPGDPWHLSVDVGLMQMNSYWTQRPIEQMLDPRQNVRAAIDLALSPVHASRWRPDWTFWVAHRLEVDEDWVPAAARAVNWVMSENDEDWK